MVTKLNTAFYQWQKYARTTHIRPHTSAHIIIVIQIEMYFEKKERKKKKRNIKLKVCPHR